MSEPAIDILIRPARLDDAQSLQRHCYPEAGLEDVRDYLSWCLRQAATGRIARLVAQIDGQVVGNIQLTVRGQAGEIGSLVVAPAFRRRGVARRLLAALIELSRQRELETLEIGASQDQPAIQAFYRQMGFSHDSETKKELSHSASPEPIRYQRMHLSRPVE